MNQIAVGLIIGGLVGFGIGLTLAPDVVLSGISEDQQELLCLEERSQLMDEVRQALKKMETAQCAQEAPVADELPVVPVQPKPDEPQAVLAPKIEPKPDVADDQIKPAVAALGPAKPKAPIQPKADPPKPTIKPTQKEKAKTDQAEPTAKSSAGTVGGWMVQLVASPDPAEAGKVERKARALGLNTRVVLEELPDQSRSLYKVRVGPFADKSGGVEALRRIKRELKITGWLHRED